MGKVIPKISDIRIRNLMSSFFLWLSNSDPAGYREYIETPLKEAMALSEIDQL